MGGFTFRFYKLDSKYQVDVSRLIWNQTVQICLAVDFLTVWFKSIKLV